METLDEYLKTVNNENQRHILFKVIEWVSVAYPNLKFKIAWNQPMFTIHDTFIIGFSASSKHFSIAPEARAISVFEDKIKFYRYSYSPNLFRIKWAETIPYDLIQEIIDFNINDKKECPTFWRKE